MVAFSNKEWTSPASCVEACFDQAGQPICDLEQPDSPASWTIGSCTDEDAVSKASGGIVYLDSFMLRDSGVRVIFQDSILHQIFGTIGCVQLCSIDVMIRVAFLATPISARRAAL